LQQKAQATTWIKRIAVTALLVEVTYVVLLNLALQLPLTQTLINKIKPEKFHISWESAWTWYPFRVHVQGAKGNGQARSQQWEFEAESVSASIDILPLIFKRVWIDGVRVTDVSYFQRPRLKPDKDYSAIMEFFPPISGRDIIPAITTPKKKKRAWHVDIEDIELAGEYQYWIQNFKGGMKGALNAELSVVSRGGLFSLAVAGIDMQLRPHFINENFEVLRSGDLKGAFGLTPMVPQQSKGLKMLPHVVVDADINVDINSLRFIEAFTRSFGSMNIDGGGQVDGHLNMADGKVLAGTDLTIDADNIDVDFYDKQGDIPPGLNIRFYYNKDLPIGTELKGDICEWNEFDQKETVLSPISHKFSFNSDFFTTNANVNLPDGYTYNPHHSVKLRVYSDYIEVGDKNDVSGVPDYSFFSNYEQQWRWRDIYSYGFVDSSGNGVNYPFLNGEHYPFADVLFLQTPLMKNNNVFNNIIFQPIIDNCE